MKISERRSYQLNCGFFFFLVGDSQTIFNGSVFLDCYLAGENFVLNVGRKLCMGPDPVPGGENLFCFNFGSGSFLE